MTRHRRHLILLLACVATLSASGAPAQSQIETRKLEFAKGASSATVKGSIKGDQTVDYAVSARAGQTMNVSFKPGNASSYFNVLPPGSNDVAVFVGSSGGNDWTGKLDSDGVYKIRVYLMRSAARRNEVSDYTLTVGITGTPSASPIGPAPRGDAKVSGTKYHAVGKVPCSLGDAAPGSIQCDFGVIRGAPGQAEVHVTPPGGLKTILIFAGGKVTTPQGALKASKSGDLWIVDVNDYEHYRIPEAVVSGG